MFKMKSYLDNYDMAEKHYAKLGKRYEPPGKKRNGTPKEKIVGIVCELTMADHFACPVVHEYKEERGWDFEWAGFKVDVKSKSNTCGRVDPWFDSLVKAYVRKNESDIYIHTNAYLLDGIFQWVMFCGWCWKEEYYDLARFIKEGDPLGGPNGHTAEEDLYLLPYNKLRSWNALGVEGVKDAIRL